MGNNFNVLVNYVGRKGAGPLYAYEMTKALIGAGCNVYVVTSSFIENRSLWDCLPKVKMIYLPGYSNLCSFLVQTILFRLFGRRKLKKELLCQKIDVCYLPMETPWGGLIAKEFEESKIITTVHDPIPHSTSKNNYLLTRFQHFFLPDPITISDDIVVLSDCFVKTVSERFHFPAKNIHVIPHGDFNVYFDLFRGGIHQFPKGKFHFLFFGRIDAYKGLHTLALAYQKLASKRSDVSLSVVGKGDFSNYNLDFASSPNFELINRWIPDSEVASFFHGENTIVVLPYTDATQSGVIPIAAYAGCPVIATRTGGLIEQTNNGETAELCEPGNSDDLFRAMELLCNDDGLRRKIILNGKNNLARNNWDSLAQKLIKIFGEGRLIKK